MTDKRMHLPAVGHENFEEIIKNNMYFVDKTEYLNNLFFHDSNKKNMLFIRPRRFGKTLNMSMIKAFCELDYQNPGDTSKQQRLFIDNGRNFDIARDEHKELRDKVMGQIPVIAVSFKGIEGSCFYEAVDKFISKILKLYTEFYFLTDSEIQQSDYKEHFKEIYSFCMHKKGKLFDKDNLALAKSYCGQAIPFLAQMLYMQYKRKVLFLIDEYDVPLQKAMVADEPYYKQMLDIIRDISSNTFKQDPDPWLDRGIITGCLKIAHQSVFTDANNFMTFSMEMEPYNTFFGFTQKETDRVLSDFGVQTNRDEIQKWYDGYRFGKEHIYCPWSLMSYCSLLNDNADSKPKPFWVNVSGNDIITLYTNSLIEKRKSRGITQLQELMNGNSVQINLAEFTTYPDLRDCLDINTFLTVLLHTGYVTFDDSSDFSDSVSVRIPDHEVRKAFEVKFAALYSQSNTKWSDSGESLLEALLINDVKKAQEIINSVLRTYISIRHSGHEQYYHGFMQWLLVQNALDSEIEVQDECESGLGYSDMILDDFDNKRAVILELKREKESKDKCRQAAQSAIEQIIEKRYADRFSDEYKEIYGIGIGFYKKHCEIVSVNLVKA